MATQTLEETIREWKKRRNAVILAHNYQIAEVQDLADFTGDSLELSRKAMEVGQADVIVFCGVHFMAETTAILNPEKTVLIPDREAGCPMADMITGEQLREMKAAHPDAVVICYVNSTAEVKAESDCCCTSGNALAIVRSYPEEQEIIFVPDQYLGAHTAEKTGRRLILWPGYCPSHARIMESDIEAARREHPDAEVLVHPECKDPIRHAADQVLSTGGMARYAASSSAREFIIGTETGMLHRLRRDNPGKVFHVLSERCLCPNMKKIRVEKILWSLENLAPKVEVPEPIRKKAKWSILAMLGRSS
jgi:quinolinate synthase